MLLAAPLEGGVAAEVVGGGEETGVADGEEEEEEVVASRRRWRRDSRPAQATMMPLSVHSLTGGTKTPWHRGALVRDSGASNVDAATAPSATPEEEAAG